MSKLKAIKLSVIGAVVLGTCAVFANSAVTRPVAAEEPSDMQTSGALIYEKNCARCHGDSGEGDKGPNLNSARKQTKWRNSPQTLINKIGNGGGKMPRFKGRLTASQIKAVAGFVRTL